MKVPQGSERDGDHDAVRLALTGAAGGFARTLLPPARRHPGIRPAVLCDLDTAALHRVCRSSGYAEADLVQCHDRGEVRDAVDGGRIAVVSGPELLDPAAYDVVVEATGDASTGYDVASAAIAAGRHVVMVTKEAHATAGPQLEAAAAAAGVRLLPVEGDQPANLVALVTWARECGLDVVAAGKAGEYDVVLDAATGRVRYLENEVDGAALRDLWQLEGSVEEVLAARADALRPLDLRSAADVCEMTVAANALGLDADVDTLHHPLARVPELADVYAARDHGGIRRTDGVVDVFTLLRRSDEASFGGGVFAVVRGDDPGTFDVLADKGHVISRDRRYACVYWPHHLMGLETVRSIVAAARRTSPAASAPHDAPDPETMVMFGVAGGRLPAGERLTVAGHHHDIAGVEPRLSRRAPRDAVPFYLLDGAVVIREIPAGTPIRVSDVRVPPSSLAQAVAPAGGSAAQEPTSPRGASA